MSSSYVKHPFIQSVDMADKPRLLTPDEINDVLDAVPPNTIPYPKDAEFIRRQIQEKIGQSLIKEEICPSGIPELKNQIVRQHKESLLERGTPIGFTSSEAIGAITTQATLNTFHSSGSKNDIGSDAIKDLIFARTNITAPKAIIHFADKYMSVEDVIMMRSKLVAVYISFLMIDKDKSYDVFRVNEHKFEWWYVTKQDVLGVSNTFMRIYFDTKKLYGYQVTLRQIAEALLRGEGNDELIKVVISPMNYGFIDIFPLIIKNGKVIETIHKIKDQCSIKTTMTPLPKVFPKGKLNKLYSEEYIIETTFLENTFRPTLSCIRLKGISGIKNLQPVKNDDITSIILSQTKITDISMVPEEYEKYIPLERLWLIRVSAAKVSNMGITIDNLTTLFEHAGIETLSISTSGYELIVKTPANSYKDKSGRQMLKNNNVFLYPIRDFQNRYIVLSDNRVARRITSDNLRYDDDEGKWVENIDIDINIYRNPDEVINTDKGMFVLVNVVQDKDMMYEVADKLIKGTAQKPDEITKYAILEAEKEYDNKKKEDKSIRRPLIMRLAEYVYAYSDLDLSNNTVSKNIMKELLALPYLDNRKTYCNSMHIIRAALGIEPARRYIQNALYNSIFGRGSYVNPQNICIIAEIMTNKGMCFGATFNGISRQPGGHLYISTVEKAGEVNISEAFAGRKEDLRNVSASIFVGSRMSVGTGSFNIGQRVIENGVERIAVNDELFTVLSKDDRYKDVMKEMEKEANEIREDKAIDDQNEEFFNELDRFEALNIISESEEIFSTEDDYDRRAGVVEGRLVRPTFSESDKLNSNPVTSTAMSKPDNKLSDTIMSSRFSSNADVEKESKRRTLTSLPKLRRKVLPDIDFGKVEVKESKQKELDYDKIKDIF